MKRLQSNLYFIFFILFIPALFLVSGLFLGKFAEFKNILYLAALVAVFIAAFIAINKSVDRFGGKFFYGGLICLSIVILGLQLVHCLGSYTIPLKGDMEAMYTAVKEAVSYGELTDSVPYFLRHSHQMFTMFFYTVVNRIFVMLGSSDAVNMTGTVALNCLMTTTGGILLTFAVRRLSDEKFALFTMFLFAMCNSYWGSSAYLYSHPLSVFFLCLAIFCFTFCCTAEHKIAKAIWLVVSGIAFALCKSVEGITLIALIAALIYLFISAPSFKKFIFSAVAVVASFTVTVVMISTVYNVLGIIDTTNQEQEEIPLTHWIMMGFSETGTYQEDDYQATVNTPGKDAKLALHKKELARRISERSPDEMTKFLISKQKMDWLGKTYGEPVIFVDNSCWNFAYRFIMVITILLCSVVSFIKKWKNKSFDVDFAAFSRIYIMGIFLFFFIWECYTTYLFSSLPMIITCAVLSIYEITAKKSC